MSMSAWHTMPRVSPSSAVATSSQTNRRLTCKKFSSVLTLSRDPRRLFPDSAPRLFTRVSSLNSASPRSSSVRRAGRCSVGGAKAEPVAEVGSLSVLRDGDYDDVACLLGEVWGLAEEEVRARFPLLTNSGYSWTPLWF